MLLLPLLLIASLAWSQEGTRGGADALAAKAAKALEDGQYELALRWAAEAAAFHRKLNLSRQAADDLNTGATAQLYLGRYAEALAGFERALEIDRAAGFAEGAAVRLNNIGNVHFFQGRYEEARRRYEEAWADVRVAAGEPWAARVRQLTAANLASLDQRLGRNQQALERYLELRRSSSQLSPSEEARLLANLGVLYRRLGDPRKALETYREAQRLFTRQRHRDGEIGVLKNIGIVEALDLGALDKALASFAAARRLAELSGNRRELVQTRLYQAETLRRIGRAGAARAEAESALEGAAALGAIEEQWRALYVLGRLAEGSAPAQALRLYTRAIGRIESVRSSIGPVLLRREFLADKRDVYDAAIACLLRGSGPPLEEVFQLLEGVRARLVQDRLPGAPLAEIRRRLPPLALLLEYWEGQEGAALLYATNAGAGLTPVTRIDASRLARSLEEPGSVGWEAESRRLGAALFGRLGAVDWEQVRHIIVVPDGWLYRVPIEVLRLPSGPLVLEKAAVSYLPSAALLLRESPRMTGWAPPWRERLLALANPDAGREWEPLPYGESEALAAASALTGRSEVRIRAAAAKPYFQAAAPRFPLIHLATHARAHPSDPESSRLIFSGQAGSAFEPLYLREIYGMDFRRAELVALSACGAEAGRDVRGEGVEGFSRALLAAGAGAAVTTLWRVRDDAAARLMDGFYSGLARGQPKAEALRNAKLQLWRRSGRFTHPHFWSAVVLHGDGWVPTRRYLAWWMVLLPPALLAAALLLAWRWRNRKHAGLPNGAAQP